MHRSSAPVVDAIGLVPGMQQGEHTMATPITENKEHVRRVETAINDRDRDALTDIFAENCTFQLELVELHGVDEYTEYLQGIYEAFPDLTLTFEELVGEGDLVVIHYTITGTHEGEFRGIEPTGREFEVSGMRMARIEDGEIVEVTGETRNLSLLSQLGVVELPSE